MKKVLVSLRRNGQEVRCYKEMGNNVLQVGTVYDQNHTDNHRNSMAGQSLLVELEAGDRVQVYVYTFTGLHDKPANHLTQFMGILLRPAEPGLPTVQMEDTATNGQ
jgi:hypothetical protein